MDKREAEFLQRLRETFRHEADEHLRAISAGVLELEKHLPATEQAATVEVVYREAHSMKGAARAVNLPEIEAVCQALEGVFAALKRGEIHLSAALFDQLHGALTVVSTLLVAVAEERASALKSHVTQVARELGECVRNSAVAAAASVGAMPEPAQNLSAAVPAREPPSFPSLPERGRSQGVASEAAPRDVLPLPETVRISTARLNAILLQAEEMVTAKLRLRQRVVDVRELSALLASWERERSKAQAELRTLLRHLERPQGNLKERRGDPASAAGRIAQFVQSTGETMKLLQVRLTALEKCAEQDRRTVSNMVDQLLEDTRKALMLPFTGFLEPIPMLVRELARAHGKDVELVMQGGETEVDRRILEEMKDPVVHMLRNCIDHGVEKPAERVRKKKRVQAVITIAISQKAGDQLEIVVSDDGAGIDLAKVRSAALANRAITPQEADDMDQTALALLIFRSGITTSPLVTDISGRGLGLAIVQEKVDKLGGSLAVESRRDEGATFRITLPLTLAAFRGILVRVEQQMMIVPSAHVAHSVRIKKDQVQSAENRATIQHEGKVISLVRLADVLGIPRISPSPDADGRVYVLVLSLAQQRMAFVVDEILEEQEVLVKNLGQHLPRINNIAGAAVLGTGKLVPVLNVADLMQSALNVKSESAPPQIQVQASPTKRRRLLVAEDSITTRTLLKNILESAGYSVKTAVDGVDALSTLRTEEFDLLVSDVDMPRLNGFGLTAAIRTDRKLAELPVVLVTALDSVEDRERGIDVGASAYVVKSSFEQSNLLEIVRRFL